MAEVPVVDWSTMKIDYLIRVYRALTDNIEAHEKRVKQQLEKAKGAQASIRAELLKRFNAEGIQNMSVEGVGTAFITKTSNYSVPDWSKFFDFLVQQLKDGVPPEEVFAAFQKRISKEYIVAYCADHDDQLPPGVDANTERDITVRRK